MRQYNNNYTIHDFVLQVPNEKKSWISERCGDNEEIGAESACKTASKVIMALAKGDGHKAMELDRKKTILCNYAAECARNSLGK